SQSQRERALGDLKRGRIQILVATDIASRGMECEAITHVVNYDVPHTPEDYVHRIGRTGRVDAVGDAFTLMSPEEQKDITAIERFLGRTIPRVMLPDFDYKMRPKEAAASGRSESHRESRRETHRQGAGGHAHRGHAPSHRGSGASAGGGHRGGSGASSGGHAHRGGSGTSTGTHGHRGGGAPSGGHGPRPAGHGAGGGSSS